MSAQVGAYKVALVAGTTTAGGDVLSLANPEGVDLLITRFILNVTTPATGAANIDVGVGATANTSDADLIDGADIGSAAILLDNIDDQGTDGQSVLLWASDTFLTATPSGSAAGLVGYAYIQYVRL